MMDVRDLNKVIWKLSFALLAIPFHGFAIEENYPLEEGVSAWFTGPLLSPDPLVIPLGSYISNPSSMSLQKKGGTMRMGKK